MYWKLAGRNVWRNPRRTVVILVAVVIGVWSMIASSAMMTGLADQMVRNGIATLTGHIQIHRRGFRLDPAIENSIADSMHAVTLMKALLPDGARWASRVRVNAIASNARHTRGVGLVGIDPSREANVSFIMQAIADGTYLTPDDPYGVIVGQALLDQFETRLGRKLILMSQTVQGEIASQAFQIRGVFRAEMEATEERFVFVNLQTAQHMLQLGEGISEICLLLRDHQDVDRVAGRLRGILPAEKYEVSTWKELLPLVTGTLKMYDIFVLLWYLIAAAAMGFGILNTILMAVLERIREFGLLRTLGMKPNGIMKQVMAETLLLLVIGMAVGNLLGFVTVAMFSAKGIDLSALAAGLEFSGIARVIYPVIGLRDVLLSNLTVFVLGLLVSAYPAIKASRYTPVQAMRHV